MGRGVGRVGERRCWVGRIWVGGGVGGGGKRGGGGGGIWVMGGVGARGGGRGAWGIANREAAGGGTRGALAGLARRRPIAGGAESSEEAREVPRPGDGD